MTIFLLLALLLGPSVTVDGCDATLTNPGGIYVELTQAGDDGVTTFDAVDGSVTVTMAAGSWAATWDDGTVQTFEGCAADPGPEYEPFVDSPEPTDDLEPGESIAVELEHRP